MNQMVLGILEESISRKLSVFLSFRRFVLRLHESDGIGDIGGISLKKVICLSFFQTFCFEASRIRWYWGYRRNQSQECHLSPLCLDHYLLLSYQRNQIIWKGRIFHRHLPLRSVDRTIGPWSNVAWVLRGSEVLHYPQVGRTEECQGN